MSTTEKKKLLIRADASPAIGHGHIMRMLALAQAWQKVGGVVEFICATIPDKLVESLQKRGFSVSKLQLADDEWAGSERDAQLLAEMANQAGCRSVMLDGYRFDLRYVKNLKAAVSVPVSMMVDEQPSLELLDAIDLVVFPSLRKTSESGEFPEKLLDGRDFVLIREEFINAKRNESSSSNLDFSSVEEPIGPLKLLICLGGSDPANFTSCILDALGSLESDLQQRIQLRVIAGSSNQYLDQLEQRIDGLTAFQDSELWVGVEDIPQQLLWSDAVISAAGGMVWELLFMGLEHSAAVCVIAENQTPFYDSLIRETAVCGLGGLVDDNLFFDVQALKDWILQRFSESRPRETRSNQECFVDGMGGSRICETILTRFG